MGSMPTAEQCSAHQILHLSVFCMLLQIVCNFFLRFKIMFLQKLFCCIFVWLTFNQIIYQIILIQINGRSTNTGTGKAANKCKLSACRYWQLYQWPKSKSKLLNIGIKCFGLVFGDVPAGLSVYRLLPRKGFL